MAIDVGCMHPAQRFMKRIFREPHLPDQIVKTRATRALALSLLLSSAPLGAAAQDAPTLSIEQIEQAYTSGDFVTARRGLEQIAQDGTALTQFRLGYMMVEGQGGSKDPEGATIWLAMAADANHGPAITLLSRLYLAGIGDEARLPRLLEQLEDVADSGDVEAQLRLGQFHLLGLGTDKNPSAALQWMLGAARQKNPEAQYEVSALFARGAEGVAPDAVKSLKWLQRAAENGYVKAQLTLAFQLEQGVHGEPDARAAVEWYRRAAEAGDPIAARNLGTHYMNGSAVNPNPKEGLRWLLQAAEQGDAGAQSNLGYFYSSGIGVEQNYETAVHWYSKATESGLLRAALALAWLQEQGLGTEKSIPKAAELYEFAARRGEKAAAIRLGHFIATGETPQYETLEDAAAFVSTAARDGDQAAMAWLLAQAEAGLSMAQAELGGMFYEGIGVERDLALAAKYLTSAAEQGDLRAQAQLALLFAQGEGVEQDYVRAHMWANLAAAAGYAPALKSRDVFAQLMTPEQIAQAQELARSFDAQR